MSADNTIVILATNRTFKEQDKYTWITHQPLHKVYRVANVKAWDDFEWYKENQPYNAGAYLLENFRCSAVFLDYKDALKYAEDMLKAVGYVEYGIQVEDTDYFFIGEY